MSNVAMYVSSDPLWSHVCLWKPHEQ